MNRHPLTLPTALAQALPRGCLTLQRVIHIARALISAPRAIHKRCTTRLARVPAEAGRAETTTRYRITRRPIATHTPLAAVRSVVAFIAWPVAELTLPALAAEALPRL